MKRVNHNKCERAGERETANECVSNALFGRHHLFSHTSVELSRNDLFSGKKRLFSVMMMIRLRIDCFISNQKALVRYYSTATTMMCVLLHTRGDRHKSAIHALPRNALFLCSFGCMSLKTIYTQQMHFIWPTKEHSARIVKENYVDVVDLYVRVCILVHQTRCSPFNSSKTNQSQWLNMLHTRWHLINVGNENIDLLPSIRRFVWMFFFILLSISFSKCNFIPFNLNLPETEE